MFLIKSTLNWHVTLLLISHCLLQWWFCTFVIILISVNTFNVEQIISPVAQYSGLLLTLGATRWTELHMKDVLHSISCQLGLSVAHDPNRNLDQKSEKMEGKRERLLCVWQCNFTMSTSILTYLDCFVWLLFANVFLSISFSSLYFMNSWQLCWDGTCISHWHRQREREMVVPITWWGLGIVTMLSDS